ncbi:hypothetical protein JCM8547_006450 [Rhodosporidiobolus lusitaniae]
MKLVVKASLGHAHPRRISFPDAFQLAKAFSLKPGSFRLAYRDDDNDLIQLDSTSALLEAVDFFASDSPQPSTSSAYSGSSSISGGSWLSSLGGGGGGGGGQSGPAGVTVVLALLPEYEGPALSDGGSSVFGGGGGSDAGSEAGGAGRRSLDLSLGFSSSSSSSSAASSRRPPPSQHSGSSSFWLRQQFWPSNSTSSGALSLSEGESGSEDEWERETVSSASQVWQGQGRERRGRGRGRGQGRWHGGRAGTEPEEWERERHEERWPPQSSYPPPPNHPSYSDANHHSLYTSYPPPHQPHFHYSPPHQPYPYSQPPPPPHHHYPYAPPPPPFPFPFSFPFLHFLGSSFPPPFPASTSQTSLSTASPSSSSSSLALRADLAAVQRSDLLASSVSSGGSSSSSSSNANGKKGKGQAENDRAAEEEDEEEEDETGSAYTVTDSIGGTDRDGVEPNGVRKEGGVEEEAGKTEWKWAAPPMTNGTKESAFRCAGCGKTGYADEEARFRCAVCEGWEICRECERSLPPSLDSHDPAHILLKLPPCSSLALPPSSAALNGGAYALPAAKAAASSLTLSIPSSSASSTSSGPSSSPASQPASAGKEAYDAYCRSWWEWYAALPQPPQPPAPPPGSFPPPAHSHYSYAASPSSYSPYSSCPPPSLHPPSHHPHGHGPFGNRVSSSPFLFAHHGVSCSSCGVLIPGPSHPYPHNGSSSSLALSNSSSNSSRRSSSTTRLSPSSASQSFSAPSSKTDPLEPGIRWLCANCPTVPSFDLCPSCEARSEEVHDPSHCFLRITHPLRRDLPSVRGLLPKLYKEESGQEEGKEGGEGGEGKEGEGGGDLIELRSERGGGSEGDGKAEGRERRRSRSSGGRSVKSGGGAGGKGGEKEEVLHPNVICDGCAQPIRGAWMRCCHCPLSYDLCASCLTLSPFTPSPHPPNHVFVKLKRLVDVALLREVTRLRTRNPRGLLQVEVYG